MYSVSEENYIKAIYHLEKLESSVSTNGLAARMHTKPASVTDMLKRLKGKDLLDYEPYHGVRLSPEGKMVNTIGFQWDEVHEIAEELEHVQHPVFIDKLDDFLGRPTFDPHGDPIPDKNGRIADVNYRLLTDANSGEKVVFSSVGLQTPELMKMLNHKKVSLGDTIEILEKFEFDQSLDVTINNTTKVSLSYRLARYILIPA
jgi:DtxR family Mn-dependent transcriptional regulator